MNDFISREELFKRFQKQAMTLYGKDSERYQMVMDIMDGVRFAPEVDAEPVRHGHWIKNNDRDGWNCSICHKNNCYAYLYNYDIDVEDIQDYYCPNCGAKMDEVSE